MTVRRSALVLIGVATLASFAAGWWAGDVAKTKPTIRAGAQEPEFDPAGCLKQLSIPETTQFIRAVVAPPDDTMQRVRSEFLSSWGASRTVVSRGWIVQALNPG